MSKKAPRGKAAEEPPKEEPPAVRTGRGRFVNVDGSEYGVYRWQGEEYEGNWQNDSLEGVGRCRFSSGAVYRGSLSSGRFEGEGVYSWPDGSEYSGGWRNGRMHGAGRYHDGQGIEWEGEFFNGRFRSEKAFVSLRPGE